MHISGKPVYYRLTRWQKAIPQYTLGYGGIIADAEQALTQHPGVFLCSNFYRGISVGDCVMSARTTSDAVTRYLGLREG
ncbi:Protoporphyrinogen oxidase [compost metagenome]